MVPTVRASQHAVTTEQIFWTIWHAASPSAAPARSVVAAKRLCVDESHVDTNVASAALNAASNTWWRTSNLRPVALASTGLPL
jgi:hypothetical protein